MNENDKKKILEWCGFTYLDKAINYNYGDGVEALQDLWEWPEDVKGKRLKYFAYPSLDLNFYFKYAVPKLDTIDITTKRAYIMPIPEKDGFHVSVSLGAIVICESGSDPAEAFGEALLRLIDE